MRFEWDPDKAASNLIKHGVSFSAAARALSDPQRLEIVDDRFEYDEERIFALCGLNGVIPVVVYVVRGDVLRIISARKAGKHEQRRYFQDDALQP